jgi:MFS family permease
MLGGLRDDWRVVVAVVSGGHFFSHFYLLAIPPLFPLLRSEFGLTNAELGLIVSLLMIGGLLQAPVGNIVDQIGAKWVFAIGIGVTAAGMMLIGLGDTYPAILAFAVLSGLGQSAFHPADYALIDTVTEPGIRGKAFSVHTFSGYAGFAVAPILVGTVAATMGWQNTLFIVGSAGLIYAVFAAVALVPAYRASIESTTEQPDIEPEGNSTLLSTLARPGVLAMVGFFLMVALASKGIQSFTTVLTVDSFGLSQSVGNNLLTAFFALGAIGVLTGGVLSDRYAPGQVIAGTIVVGVSLLFVIISGIVPLRALPLIVLFGLSGFFLSLIPPSRDQLVSTLSASGSTGQSFGIVFTGGTVGALIGPVFLGAVADTVSITMTFVLVGVIYLLAGGLAFSLGRNLRHKPGTHE